MVWGLLVIGSSCCNNGDLILFILFIETFTGSIYRLVIVTGSVLFVVLIFALLDGWLGLCRRLFIQKSKGMYIQLPP